MDADIAIIDLSGNPIWLIDAVCPNLPPNWKPNNSGFSLTPMAAKSWIESKVEEKFNSKFSKNIANHPTAQAAININLIKADLISPHLNPPMTQMYTKLSEELKRRCPRLGYALAGRFQSDISSPCGIKFIKLAEYRIDTLLA